MLFCHSASRIKAITFVPGGVSFTLIGNQIATVEINDNFRLTTVIGSVILTVSRLKAVDFLF